MPSSLLTGVSGLIAHQRMLDVVGNNLANLNTTGYKAQRVLFSDLYYTTVKPGTSSSGGEIGGTNPSQIGSGVSVSSVGRDFGQGNLDSTGQQFDIGIQGDGFFVLNDGQANIYTRAGAFTLDADGRLVDPSTGYLVQRTGPVGEASSTEIGFQTAGDTSISVPLGATIPGAATSAVEMIGNLSSVTSEPTAEQLISSSPFTASSVVATSATLLNALDSNSVDYVGTDSIVIQGTDYDGSAINTTFAVSATTTLGDMVNAISSAFPGATAALDANGNLTLTSDTTGPTSMSLSMLDSVGNTGTTDFGNHVTSVGTEGADPDVINHTIEVFDPRGGSHTLSLAFTKTGSNTFDLVTTVDPGVGTITDGSIQSIQFNEDGSFLGVQGTGAGDSNITVQFAGINTVQTIDFSFGEPGSYGGFTHLATDSTPTATQDGLPPGELTDVQIGSDGLIEGVASNGVRIPIAQIAVASFRNSSGLSAIGQNYYKESLNSGTAEIGSAGSGNRGSLSGSQLEASNVDAAYEFTRLIVAQRGFSANARTVTVSDEVLEELTNLIR